LAGVEDYVAKYTNKNKETDHFDGLSFASTLLGKAGQPEHEFLYWEFEETNQVAVRMGDWKMVSKDGKPHLYDLSKDIHEDNDIAEQHPDIVKKMVEIAHSQHTESPYFKVTLPE
jgi:arylsulfatase A-like enzyme